MCIHNRYVSYTSRQQCQVIIVYYIGGTSSVDICVDLAVFKIKKTYLVVD